MNLYRCLSKSSTFLASVSCLSRLPFFSKKPFTARPLVGFQGALFFCYLFLGMSAFTMASMACCGCSLDSHSETGTMNNSAHSSYTTSTHGSESSPPSLPSTPHNPIPAPHSPTTPYTHIPVDKPIIAITFDDGPHPILTPKLLDLLKEKHIHATFFVIGQNAAAYPAILQRMIAEGHEVENHSWSHPQLTHLSLEGVRAQVEKTNQTIEQATHQAPHFLRPPYGATNNRLNQMFVNDYGLKVVLWSVDPMDWKYRNAQHVMHVILQETRPGSIILAHDIHPTTIEAMPQTLDGLLAKGFQLVTLSDLFAQGASAQNTTSAQSAPSKAVSSEPLPSPAPVPAGTVMPTPAAAGGEG